MKIIISRSMHYSAFTPEIDAKFRRWFGKSVVHNGDGTPKICYHGSQADIKAFDPTFTGKGLDQSGIGFYFTSDSDDAQRYTSNKESGDNTGGNITPVYLKIQKPINFDHQPEITATQVRKLTGNVYVRKAYKQFLADNYDLGYVGFTAASQECRSNMVGMGLIHAMFTIFNDIYDGTDVASMFPKIFKDATGYDGIIRKNYESSTHYIVFSPTQIKSAVGNNGKFSVRNPDLTK